jgi:hypothetical protein
MDAKEREGRFDPGWDVDPVLKPVKWILQSVFQKFSFLKFAFIRVHSRLKNLQLDRPARKKSSAWRVVPESPSSRA